MPQIDFIQIFRVIESDVSSRMGWKGKDEAPPTSHEDADKGEGKTTKRGDFWIRNARVILEKRESDFREAHFFFAKNFRLSAYFFDRNKSTVCFSHTLVLVHGFLIEAYRHFSPRL